MTAPDPSDNAPAKAASLLHANRVQASAAFVALPASLGAELMAGRTFGADELARLAGHARALANCLDRLSRLEGQAWRGQ